MTAGLALFLSGFAALVYEVCWIRHATLVFGATVPALSTVLAVFFAGLALGSEAFGRAASRWRRPLAVFALAETVPAIWAVATPWAFSALHALYGIAYRSWGFDAPSLGVARVGLVAVVLLPATFLMGAGLPLFTRQRVSGSGHLVRGVGGLYAINTLGAAAGCAFAGFAGIPAWGVDATLRVGALAGCVAAGLAWRQASAVVDVAPPSSRADASWTVAALFFLVGLVALGEEVLWTRYLSLLLRTTVTTYTITLTVVLLGIVAGSAVAARWFDTRRSLGGWFGLLQCANGLCVLGIMLLPPSAWARLGESVLVYLLLLLPPSILSGMSFPLAVRLFVDDPSRAAPSVGRMAAFNTLGGIAGATLVGFLVLPRWGLQNTLYALTATSLAIGIVAWMTVATRRPSLAAASVAAVALWVVLPIASDTEIPADHLEHDGRLVDFREGVAAHVAVLEREEILHLEIDRWWQGSSGHSHQVMAAHVPMILHPDPRAVLVVGLGTGQTPSRFLDYDIERLECVDIEPAVFAMARAHFASEWMDDPRFTALETDGRNHIAHTDATYDLISLELGQLFRPGVASFYTVEFYRQARARLRRGGLAAQFVPLPFLTEEQLRRLVRSFVDVFGHSVLWYNTSELLLIGGADVAPIVTEERLERLRENPRLRQDLQFSPWGGSRHWLWRPEVFMAGFLCGAEGLRTLAGDGDVYHDDHPVLEYGTADANALSPQDAALVPLLEASLEPVTRILPTFALADSAEAIRRLNLADITTAALLRQVTDLRQRADEAGLERLLQAAARSNPQSLRAHRLLGELELLRNQPQRARVAFERALAIDERDVRAHRNLAHALILTSDLAQAATHLRTVLEQRPDDAQAHNNLGAVLARQGRFDEARGHFQRALDLQPAYADALANLARLPSPAPDGGTED